MPDKKTLRTFGYIWAAIFFAIAYSHNYNAIFLIISLCFLLSASFYPEIYFKTHIFQKWTKFGNFIGAINSKVIITILFFLVFTPIAFFLKLTKKDLLKKEIDRNCKSYFIKRVMQPGSMKNQY